MPDDETLAAAGITRAQAAALLPQTATGSGSVYSDLAAAGATDYGTAYAMLLSNGYNSTNAQRLATYFAENYMPSQSAGTNASTGTGTTSRVLYNNGNLTSAQVQELQAALGVTADGYFGPASQAAANARYGTTSAADAWAAYKAANSLAPTRSLTSLDYSPDEGVFTWNGKRYSSVSALENDLNAYISQGIITPAMEAELKRKLSVYGFNS